MNKKIMIGSISAVILIALGSAYYISTENHKKEVLNNMDISFTETKEIEYGSQEFDIQSLIQEVKHAEIMEYPTLDTMSVGEQTLTFTLTQEGLEKTVNHTITIIDTQKPEIKLKKDNIEIAKGDAFNPKANVESAFDKVDGDLRFVRDIDNNKGVYAIEGKVDTKKTGNYKCKVVAVDINGNRSEKEFNVKVRNKSNHFALLEDGTIIDLDKDVEQDTTPDHSYLPDYAQQVLTIVNQERAKEGLAPLAWDDNLAASANIRAKEIAMSFSHTRPDGSSCVTAVNGNYSMIGENIAGGATLPRTVMEGWMNSPGHRENIMHPDLKLIGISCYVDKSSHYVYNWVQMFGTK